MTGFGRDIEMPEFDTVPLHGRYLFVDGNYLSTSLDAIGTEWFDEPLKLDYESLSKGFNKCFFYDSLPPEPLQSGAEYQDKLERWKAARSDKEAFFDSVRELEGWHVVEGLSKRKNRKNDRTVEQKEVDVALAVDLLTHTYRRNMREVVLLTGDGDFRPLVEAVVREGMYITIWYFAGHESKLLLNEADHRKSLDIRWLHERLEPAYRRRHPLPVECAPDSPPRGFCHQLSAEVKSNHFVQVGSDQMKLEDSTRLVLRERFGGDLARLRGNKNWLNLAGNDLKVIKRFYEQFYRRNDVKLVWNEGISIGEIPPWD